MVVDVGLLILVFGWEGFKSCKESWIDLLFLIMLLFMMGILIFFDVLFDENDIFKLVVGM